MFIKDKLLLNFRNACLIILGFSLPLSTAISNILLISLLASFFMEKDLKDRTLKIFSSKWMISIIMLILLYYFSFFITSEFNSILEHYHAIRILKIVSLLFILPALYTFRFSHKTISQSVFLFLLAMFISSFLAILINYDIIYNVSAENKFKYAFFLKYTDHNVFLLPAIIISILVILLEKIARLFKLIIMFFIAIYIASFIHEGGVAGWITFLILISCLSLYLLRYNLKYILTLFIFILCSSVFLYSNSETISKRINYKLENIASKERTVMIKKTIDLIKLKPIEGYGVGSWRHEFDKTSSLLEISEEHKTPHNNYLYVFMELGIFGVLILISIFFFQANEMRRYNRHLWILLPLMFLILMMADTYFLAQNTLTLYLFLSVASINYQGRLS